MVEYDDSKHKTEIEGHSLDTLIPYITNLDKSSKLIFFKSLKKYYENQSKNDFYNGRIKLSKSINEVVDGFNSITSHNIPDGINSDQETIIETIAYNISDLRYDAQITFYDCLSAYISLEGIGVVISGLEKAWKNSKHFMVLKE